MPVKEIFPSAKSWKDFLTTFDFSSSISIPLVLGLLIYPPNSGLQLLSWNQLEIIGQQS